VTAAVSARLAAVEVHMGDTVLEGQVVATLDPQTVLHGADGAQARLQAREAQRRQAVAARAIARDKHGRAGRLQGLVPEAELAEAKLAVAAAEADVDRAAAEARIERVEIEKSADALRDTTIRAPMAGEIAQRIAEPGTRLAAGDPIARIVDRRRMVRFAVPIDESPPAPGAALVVTCEDPIASSHSAVVAHVAPQIDGAARVVLVEAHLLEPEGTRIGAVCRARSHP
jgi:multidrug efflux pump subunit AcrA (membrane-fusion protein)